jgi:lambda family phage portal protein
VKLLEQALAVVSPGWAAQRARDRRTFELLSERRYEGATKGRHAKGWKSPRTSGNAAAFGARETLRDRSRDLARNNPWAARALQVLTTNVVGTGIRPQVRQLGTAFQQRAKDFEALWYDWAGTTVCDADRRVDFYGLQAAALRCLVESGDVLIRRRWRRRGDGIEPPLQLQLLEPDHLDTAKDVDSVKGGGRIENGIEFDRRGQRVAYHLFVEHPGDLRGRRKALSVRIPAADVLHLFRADRPGQIAGVPWCAPVIVAMRDLADFQHAELVRQKIAALWAAFIRKNDPDGTGTTEKTEEGQQIEKLEPGILEYLEPGEDITFSSPPAPNGYDGFVTSQLRAIAAALGITYEALSGDYSRVNFSSARMGWLESGRNFDAIRRQLLVPQLCAPVWQWFLEAAEFSGVAVHGLWATWTSPRREMIDPTREVPAAEKAIRAGLTTLSETLRQQGYDPEDMLLERQRDDRWLDELGLVLDSDPRKKSAAGSGAQPERDEDEPKDGDDAPDSKPAGDESTPKD